MFHKNDRRWDGLHGWCMTCMAEAASARYERQRERLLALGREYRKNNSAKRKDAQMRVRFGITLAERNSMADSQNGGCAICGGIGKRGLHVDHCHATGNVRGLLCVRCNTAIGAFRDSPELLDAAAAYLRRFTC